MDIKEQNRTPRKRPSTEKLDGNSESETKRRFANNRTNIRSAGSGAGTSMQATSLPRRRASKTDKESPAAPQRQVTVKKTFYNIPRDAARLRKPAFENSEEFPVLAEKRGRGLKKKRAVKILFLGGVGEIGKNMTAIEYGGDIVIIDAGLTFPNNEDMPGIDLVVPDITYLVQNKDKVKGILLTHGHEDHIGGIPYLLKELNPGTPVYGTKLTLMLADNKIQEHRIQNVTERVVQPGDRIKLGVFEVEFINVNHSISGAVALAIRTPCGLIYHSGDFKIDLTPVAGKPIDLERIAELGHEGVLLYMGESTNIERPGYTMSETVVGTTLDHLFSENMNRRLIIATFASNVHRLQQIIDLAVKYRRKVALSGRSMFKVVDAAVKIGELKIPEGVLIDIEKNKNLFDGELVIVSTGSQGEPMSALTRMAMNSHKKVVITPNDFIIISANPIPGNEKHVTRVVNELMRSGAEVIYEDVHVSGHACQEELKLIHALTKPKFFIPVHGEYKHLVKHAQIAYSMGMPESNVIIGSIGDVIETDGVSMKIVTQVPSGRVMVDGLGVGDVGSIVLRDRKHLAQDGLIIVVIGIERTANLIVSGPDIISRGFVYVRESEELMEEARQILLDTLQHCSAQELKEWGTLKNKLRDVLSDYIYGKTKRSPMILPIIMEV